MQTAARAIGTLVAVIVALVMAVAVAAPAQAGSNNGTRDWWHSASCTASGGRFDATNYDIRVNGTTWQEYHLDADRAGGTGTAPKVYFRQSGQSSWTLLSKWNDFYIRMSNEWLVYDFKTLFTKDNSTCFVWAF